IRAVIAAGAAIDRAVDRVLRHVRLLGRDNGGAEARIDIRVREPAARRRGQFPDDLGEDLGALFVLRALAVHDVLELGMTSHERSLIRWGPRPDNTIPRESAAIRPAMATRRA